MNGYLFDALLELVCYPQETVDSIEDDSTHRCVVDPETRPIQSFGNELDLAPATSRPVAGSYEIGGGFEIEHEFDLLIAVQHGDPVKARKLRDGIATDIALRLVAASPEIIGLNDPATGQYGTRLEWLIDYTNPIIGDTTEIARFVITIAASLDG